MEGRHGGNPLVLPPLPCQHPPTPPTRGGSARSGSSPQSGARACHPSSAAQLPRRRPPTAAAQCCHPHPLHPRTRPHPHHRPLPPRMRTTRTRGMAARRSQRSPPLSVVWRPVPPPIHTPPRVPHPHCPAQAEVPWCRATLQQAALRPLCGPAFAGRRCGGAAPSATVSRLLPSLACRVGGVALSARRRPRRRALACACRRTTGHGPLPPPCRCPPTHSPHPPHPPHPSHVVRAFGARRAPLCAVATGQRSPALPPPPPPAGAASSPREGPVCSASCSMPGTWRRTRLGSAKSVAAKAGDRRRPQGAARPVRPQKAEMTLFWGVSFGLQPRRWSR